MGQRLAVPSADFIRNIGRWQQEALLQPIVITHHGRDRLMLATPERFRSEFGNDSNGDTLRSLLAAHETLLAHLEEGWINFFPDGRIQAANPAAKAFLGCADPEGQMLTSVFSDLLALIMVDRVQRVWRTRSMERFEADTADGRHLSLRVYPLSDSVAVLFQNATEIVRLQRELQDANSVTSAVEAHTQIALLRLDVRGRLEEIGATFRQWVGFEEADLKGHRLTEMVAGEERRELGARVEAVLRGAVAEQISVEVLGRVDGGMRCVLTLSPIVVDFVPRGVTVIAVRAS